MNRIYQGKVTNVEIYAQRILSASIPFSASDGEKVAKPDEASPESGERTEVRSKSLQSTLNTQPLTLSKVWLDLARASRETRARSKERHWDGKPTLRFGVRSWQRRVQLRDS